MVEYTEATSVILPRDLLLFVYVVSDKITEMN